MQAVKTDVQEGMPRPPADTVQVTFRIPSSWLIEADECADVLSRPGMRASRTDAFRAAMARGFAAIKAEGAPAAALVAIDNSAAVRALEDSAAAKAAKTIAQHTAATHTPSKPRAKKR